MNEIKWYKWTKKKTARGEGHRSNLGQKSNFCLTIKN